MMKFLKIIPLILFCAASAHGQGCAGVGTFTATGGSSTAIIVNFTPVCSGGGTTMTPKAFDIFAVSNTIAGDFATEMGLATGTSAQAGNGRACDQTGASAICNSDALNTDIIVAVQPLTISTATITAQLRITSVGSNTFTVTPQVTTNATITLGYIVYGGADLTTCLDFWVMPQNRGLATHTGCAIRPSFIEIQPSHVQTYGTPTGGAKFAWSASDFFSSAAIANYNILNTSKTANFQYPDSYNRMAYGQSDALLQLVGSSGTVCPLQTGIAPPVTVDTCISQDQNQIAALDTGYQDYVVNYNLNVQVFALVIGGGQWKVMPFTIGSSTGSYSFTGAGFRPISAFVYFGEGTGQSALYQPDTLLAFSFGAGLSSSNRWALGTSAAYNVSMNTSIGQSNDPNHIINVPNPAGGTLTQCDLTSLDADGLTLNCGTVTAGYQQGVAILMSGNAPNIKVMQGGVILNGGVVVQ